MTSPALVFIVNVSNGKILLSSVGKSSILINKGQTLPQAFPLDTLQQSDEFMKFHSKGLLKLVSDPSKVVSSTPPVTASVEAPSTPLSENLTMDRQIDELNERIHAGEPPIDVADREPGTSAGTDGDPKKPNPREAIDQTAVLTAKAREASAQVHSAVAGLLTVEDSVIVPTTTRTAAPIARATEDAPGTAGALDLKGQTVSEDFPTAIIPPTSQDAKDLLQKESKALKITVSKSRDLGLLREVTYGISDLELRQYVWARVQKLEKEGDA